MKLNNLKQANEISTVDFETLTLAHGETMKKRGELLHDEAIADAFAGLMRKLETLVGRWKVRGNGSRQYRGLVH